MKMPVNTFKQAMLDKQRKIGLWVSLAGAVSAEAVATTGFDWLLIDGEHAPNDVRSLLAQLQAVAPYPAHPIVRPVTGDVALIKQLLDIGVQTLLIPMVETAEQAAQMVAATRYPPQGIRGVGFGAARASRWNGVEGYANAADAQMCVLVQVESARGLANLKEILAVDGIDGVFFGPADLSASMGHLGNANHPDVQRAILDGIRTIREAGKAPGILVFDRAQGQQYIDAGVLFIAVGVDGMLLTRACRELSASYR